MKIVIGKPPIFERAKQLFGDNIDDALFAWNDTIYNPSDILMDDCLLAHEGVHGMQHEEKGGADIWWDLYLTDDDFRADQEAKAYGEQFRVYCTLQPDRNARAKYLHALATIFASPLYKLTISHAEAKQAILNRHFDRKL